MHPLYRTYKEQMCYIGELLLGTKHQEAPQTDRLFLEDHDATLEQLTQSAQATKAVLQAFVAKLNDEIALIDKHFPTK